MAEQPPVKFEAPAEAPAVGAVKEYEERERKKQELFERIKKAERITGLLLHVFEHSLDDGIALFEDLPIDTFLQSVFLGKSGIVLRSDLMHRIWKRAQDLSLAEQVPPLNREKIKKFLLELQQELGKRHDERSRNSRRARIHFRAGSPEEALADEIDKFYEPLIAQRKIRAMPPAMGGDPHTVIKRKTNAKGEVVETVERSGTQMAESVLQKLHRAYTGHVYGAFVREMVAKYFFKKKVKRNEGASFSEDEVKELAKSLPEDDLGALLYGTHVSEDQANRIFLDLALAVFDPEGFTREVTRRWKENTYQPLDTTLYLERSEAMRKLKQEAIDKLAQKGYDPKRISFEWDERRDRFEVKYAPKESEAKDLTKTPEQQEKEFWDLKTFKRTDIDMDRYRNVDGIAQINDEVAVAASSSVNGRCVVRQASIQESALIPEFTGVGVIANFHGQPVYKGL